MPKNSKLKKILIIGSGPIIVGQAAEFDYAGTQACKAIREEGIECVLVNSNPATIMTDKGIADTVYIEPLTEDALEKIIEKERPDGVLAGFGGQTGLNLAMELDEKGIFVKYGAKLLGVNKDSIKKAEDREAFKELMLEIGEPIPQSTIATHMKECYDFIDEVGYPVIVRPAYTLGGTGGGIAENREELDVLAQRGMEASAIGQILLEKSVAGWKEIEYEVIRDAKDNCIIICSMENLDPVGIHTGDSIVVAPTQTLRDTEYQMLRNSAIRIIRSLGIEGGCNVQFALNPLTSEYIVIEVNPRVSRSSALASKAAGYPIAKIAAKIALGYSLDELSNYVTGQTSACFEPTLDYCVVKFPKFPFDKFVTASRTLGTQMQATGEVMTISRTFESALLKATAALEAKCDGIKIPYVENLSKEQLIPKLKKADDERIFAIARIYRENMMTPEEVHEMTGIDMWFLNKIKNITNMEARLREERLTPQLLREAEEMGLTESTILEASGVSKDVIQDMRIYHDIFPVYKMVDTCGGEFEALTPYYYSSYDDEDEARITDNDKILVVGSGPIRIGQGIEFDYSCVHGAWAINDMGLESIMINNNPETVSTDFDTSDKLYFEALHIDDVMNVLKKERPLGVILQFGGQTALNLTEPLYKRGINILGTEFKYVDLAEDREKFSDLLAELGIPAPKGVAVTEEDEAFRAAHSLGYPVMVRPSYVIGGRAMQVVFSDEELHKYMREAVSLSTEHPILIDKYIMGTEMEVDAIGDGEDILIPGLMEHVERTGVHSGDSIAVYPPFSLSDEIKAKMIDYTERISKALHIVGHVNIQYATDGSEVYVIEVNPRASRTVPILSKVTGVPMVELAVKTMLGKKLKDLGYGTGCYPEQEKYAVKVPVFSGAKLINTDIALGPEMKSTGEALGIDRDLDIALLKGFEGARTGMPLEGEVYVSVNEPNKSSETARIVKEYMEEGYSISASEGTAKFLAEEGIAAEMISIDDAPAVMGDRIRILINVANVGNRKGTRGLKLRRKAIEKGVTVITCMDTAEAFLRCIRIKKKGVEPEYEPV